MEDEGNHLSREHDVAVVIEASRMSGSADTDNRMDTILQEILKHAKDKFEGRSHAKVRPGVVSTDS